MGAAGRTLKRYSIAINGLPLRYTYMEKSNQDNSQRIFNSAENKQLRQTLRTHGTSAEATMWRMLKSEQICGVKFRRQFSVGPYILDFYCPRLKICIELDGDHHYSRQGYEHDLTRNTYLSHEHGITILRYENYWCPVKLFCVPKIKVGFLAWNPTFFVTFVFVTKPK